MLLVYILSPFLIIRLELWAEMMYHLVGFQNSDGEEQKAGHRQMGVVGKNEFCAITITHQNYQYIQQPSYYLIIRGKNSCEGL